MIVPAITIIMQIKTFEFYYNLCNNICNLKKRIFNNFSNQRNDSKTLRKKQYNNKYHYVAIFINLDDSAKMAVYFGKTVVYYDRYI